MQYIRTCSPDEVVLEWLKAELMSPRFSSDLKTAIKKVGYKESIITEANLASSDENKARRIILKTYREWLNLDFDDRTWQLVELDQGDVKKLHYIDYSYWNELSDNTRLVGRAAENILEGKIVFDVPNDHFFTLSKEIEAGKELPAVILASHANDMPPEILEGHLRATAYVLAQKSPHLLIAMFGKKTQDNV